MKKFLALVIAVSASAIANQTAVAGGYGSSGYGSYGSSYAAYCGSSGGSTGYSSYGSSGYSSSYGSSGYASAYTARPRAGLFARHAARHASYGSSGSSSGYGSSGYSSGYGSSGYSSGYGSSGYSSGYGSSGSSSAYGSSGYSSGYASPYYGASTRGSASQAGAPFAAPAGYHWENRGGVSMGSTVVSNGTSVRSSVGGSNPPYPAPAGYRWVRRPSTIGTGTIVPSVSPAPMIHSGSTETADSMYLVSSVSNAASDEIQLTVNVPEQAKVFVNGNATTSTGISRQFVSRDLEADQEYRFEVRVEMNRNGEKVSDTKTVVLAPGRGEVLDFELSSNEPIETVLTLNVPSDATVVLAGNSTKTEGDARTYRTMELKSGQVWDDYKIVVTKGGVVKEKSIRLIAGDDVELTFSFDEAKSDNRIAQR